MLTDKERLELARKLREAESLDDMYLILFGEPWYSNGGVANRRKLIRDMFHRLAGLIEPEPEQTCRNLGEFGGFKCSRCGFKENQLTEMEVEPQDWDYCPNCGAKVVDE